MRFNAEIRKSGKMVLSMSGDEGLEKILVELDNAVKDEIAREK